MRARPELISGDGCIECTFENLPFKPRTYEVLGEVREGFGRLIGWRRWARFRMDGDIPSSTGRNAVTRSLMFAPVAVDYRWNCPNGKHHDGVSVASTSRGSG